MHTVTFVRAANMYKDATAHDGPINEGFIYHHQWPTGWQELLFDTHEQAAKFCAARNREAATV